MNFLCHACGHIFKLVTKVCKHKADEYSSHKDWKEKKADCFINNYHLVLINSNPAGAETSVYFCNGCAKEKFREKAE